MITKEHLWYVDERAFIECQTYFQMDRLFLEHQMKVNIQCVLLGPTRSISVVGMTWFNRIQSINRPSLVICYETGKFQIMRNENDDGKPLSLYI